jgi:hypothetical protein
VAYKNKQKETQNNFTAYRAKAAFAILMRKIKYLSFTTRGCKILSRQV